MAQAVTFRVSSAARRTNGERMPLFGVIVARSPALRTSALLDGVGRRGLQAYLSAKYGQLWAGLNTS